MLTPAQLHRQKALAAQSQPTEQLSSNATLLMQLVEHKRAIGATQSIETRAVMKAEFLPMYAGFLDGVLSADGGLSEDDTTLLQELYIWVVDSFDLPKTIELFTYMDTHGIGTPERIKRKLSAFTVETLAEVGIKMLKSGTEITAEALAQIDEINTLTSDQDMDDKARATWHKFVGLTYAAHEQYAPAVENLRRADTLNDAVGVRTEIKRLEKIIADAAKAKEQQQ
ncbi:MAG: hypothetical protein LWW76_05155 [Burkholderiales bacterium]|nr:hypothetical protein [Burkholderiales bacterium]